MSIIVIQTQTRRILVVFALLAMTLSSASADPERALTGRVRARINRGAVPGADLEAKEASYPDTSSGSTIFMRYNGGGGDNDVRNFSIAHPDQDFFACNRATAPMILVGWQTGSTGGTLSADALPTQDNAVAWASAEPKMDNVTKTSVVTMQNSTATSPISVAVQGLLRDQGLPKGYNFNTTATPPKSDIYAGIAACDVMPAHPTKQIPTQGQIGLSFENMPSSLGTIVEGILAAPGSASSKAAHFTKMSVTVNADNIAVDLASGKSIDIGNHKMIENAKKVLALDPSGFDPADYENSVKNADSALTTAMDNLVADLGTKTEASQLAGLYNGRFFWEPGFELNSAAQPLSLVPAAWSNLKSPVPSGLTFADLQNALAKQLILAGAIDSAQREINGQKADLHQAPACVAQTPIYINKMINFLPVPLGATEPDQSVRSLHPEPGYAISDFRQYMNASNQAAGNIKMVFETDSPDQSALSFERTRGTQLSAPAYTAKRDYYMILRGIGCPPPATGFCRLDSEPMANSCRVAVRRYSKNKCQF